MHTNKSVDIFGPHNSEKWKQWTDSDDKLKCVGTKRFTFLLPLGELSRMDLVSSTLHKYLKHRFNGDVKLQSSEDGHSKLPPQAQTNDVLTNHQTTIRTNDDSKPESQPIEIYTLAFQKLKPSCVALRDDFQFIAAGFENSHIYLWHLSVVNAATTAATATNNNSETKQPQQQQPQPDQITPPGSQAEQPTTFNLGTKYRLLAHSGPVYSIKFVSDKDLMLSCSEDTTIRLWCLNTKCNLNIYRGHSYPVWSIAVASQSNYFASASMDSTARLWRLDKMCPLRIFCGHDEDVECVEFHPNAKYVATGSSDCTVRLWSISDGRMVRLMVGHQEPILSLSFLPNGKSLASASCDGSIKVWNLATNNVISDLSVPESPPQRSISFSPDQSFVSTCGCDSILRIWQIGVTDFTKIKETDFKQQFSKIIRTHFSRNNKLFVVAYEEATETAQAIGETTKISNG